MKEPPLLHYKTCLIHLQLISIINRSIGLCIGGFNSKRPRFYTVGYYWKYANVFLDCSVIRCKPNFQQFSQSSLYFSAIYDFHHAIRPPLFNLLISVISQFITVTCSNSFFYKYRRPYQSVQENCDIFIKKGSSCIKKLFITLQTNCLISRYRMVQSKFIIMGDIFFQPMLEIQR